MSVTNGGPDSRRLLWELIQKIFNEWKLSKEERIAVLGTIDEAYESWAAAGWMSQDGIWWRRAVKLLEIQSALTIIFQSKKKEMLRTWLRAPNSYEGFMGKSPLEAMSLGERKSLADLEGVISYLKPVGHPHTKPSQ